MFLEEFLSLQALTRAVLIQLEVQDSQLVPPLVCLQSSSTK